MNHTFAFFISRIFDPPVVMTILLTLAAFKSGLEGSDLINFLAALYIFILGVPLLFFLWLLKTGRISDWDMKRRKERIIPLFALLGLVAVDIAIISRFGNGFLLGLFLFFFFWLLGFFLITLFFKISGHTSIAMLASAFLFLWFGWPAAVSFLIPPIVGWARVVGKKHTPDQVIAGAIYSTVLVYLYFLLA